MGTICRIYEVTDHGAKLIAQIRDGRVTGKKAASMRKILKQYGFPNAPIEAVIDQLLLSGPRYGVAYIPQKERDLAEHRAPGGSWIKAITRRIFGGAAETRNTRGKA